MIDGMQSMLDELSRDVANYEWRQRDGIVEFEPHDLTELPSILLRARTIIRLTQAQLAERLGVTETEVSRYESDGYSNLTLGQLQAVAEALGVRVYQRVLVPTEGHRRRSTEAVASPMERAS